MKNVLAAGAAFCAVALAAPASAGVILNGTADSWYRDQALLSINSSVGQIYGTSSTDTFAASAVVIAPGWAVTAAHVTSGATSLKFYLDGGGNFGSFSTRTGISADAWYTHSRWNGNLGAGYDIGLIHFSSGLGCGSAFAGAGGCAAERYTGTGELGRVGMTVGFGKTGVGSTGATIFDGLKRAGENIIDTTYRTGGTTDRILLTDFDSGKSLDNDYGSRVPLAHEYMIAPGDSGGGLFMDQVINGVLHHYLVGITSFGWGRLDGNPDSDYGDVGGFTRLSQFNSWINGIMNGGTGNAIVASASPASMNAFAVAISEPSTLAMLLAGLGLLAGFGRKWRVR